MLFLLPPSETKKAGGNSPSLSQLALPFNQLAGAREQVLAALEAVCENPESAVKILKLAKTQTASVQINQEIRTSATSPALFRYDGTLYNAIEAGTLSAKELARANEQILIQSALFGLVSAMAPIPNYRFSATTRLEGLGLKEVWNQAHLPVFERIAPSAPIIDLRSKSYAGLALIPAHLENYWVEVVSRTPAGETRALNHFNKKSKGLLVRAVLQSREPVTTIRKLKSVAKNLGFEIVEQEQQLLLVV